VDNPATDADQLDAGKSGTVRAACSAADFIALEASARLVLTDSGVQEETTVLGVLCLTLRDNTERPVTLTEGTNRLVGRHPDRIVAAAREVVADSPASRASALWDGQAGQRIAATMLAAGPRRLGSGPTPAAPRAGSATASLRDTVDGPHYKLYSDSV
jgi:UDP-N-acetylglucosamine 2-epimerase (non-hydrolysing)